MLQSPAMIALMLCDFANSWGLYVLVTEGPIFFSEALCFDIKKVREEREGESIILLVKTSGWVLVQPPLPRQVCRSSDLRSHLQFNPTEKCPVCPGSTETQCFHLLCRSCSRYTEGAMICPAWPCAEIMCPLALRHGLDVPRDLQSLLVHSNHVDCIRFQWSNLFWPLQ